MQLARFDFRLATADDFDVAMEFMKSVYVTHSPLYKAMDFDDSDVEVYMKPVVKKCLASKFSVLVFEKATGELIGIRLISLWHRPSSLCHPESLLHMPLKLLSFADMMESFKAAFWGLCPRGVTTVMRREFSCVRRDFQRRGIGSRMADVFLGEKHLKAIGIDGIMSETSSIANQNLLAKKGFRPLSALYYGRCLDTNGNRIVPRDFHDGSNRVVLNFKEF